MPNQLTEDALPEVEAEMMKIVKENYPIVRREVSRKEALEIFANDPYKVELINGLPEDETITVYQQEDFVDLCRGIHVLQQDVSKSSNYYHLLELTER